jgi:TolA-binding protein
MRTISVRLKRLATIAVTTGCVLLLAGVAAAQGPGGGGGLPFSGIYQRPAVSPYTMLGNTNFGNANNQFGTGTDPLVYQQLIQPQIQQQRQQIQQLRQGSQINRLQNQVQQIQRGTTSRQVDETIRATGHASTFLNTSHFYPRR